MIGITHRAMEALLRLKASAQIDHPDIGLRLTPGDSGHLELFPDMEKPGDQVVVHQGLKVLLIDEEVSDILAGATIDCRPTAEGAELVVHRSGGGNGRAPQ